MDLFFYSNNGKYAIVRIDEFTGKFNGETESSLDFPNDWSQIVSSPDARTLFFYSNNRGVGVVAKIDQNGHLNKISEDDTFDKDWTFVVPIPSTNYLLFYSDSGKYVVGMIEEDGTFSGGVDTGFIGDGYTNIVPIGSFLVLSNGSIVTIGSYLFLSNIEHGLGQVGYIDPNGKYHKTQDLTTVDTTWSHIVPITLPFTDTVVYYLFLYSNSEGLGEVLFVGENGHLAGSTAPIETFDKDWTNIIPIGHHLFFYSTNGKFVVSSIDREGNYSGGNSSDLNFVKDWSNIVAIDLNFLFFYSNNRGIGQIANIDPEGGYHQVDISGLETDWTKIIPVAETRVSHPPSR